MQGLLEVLCQASEIAELLATCDLQEQQARQLAFNLPFDIPANAGFSEPSILANILFQCHFSRKALPRELVPFKMRLVDRAVSLTHAMVDLLASCHQGTQLKGNLRAAI